MTDLDPGKQRQLAVDVVERLRGAGYEAYWAGGCVRDWLLGRVPKDYDVATSAHPQQIRDLFGERRTLPIGAAFGVITVLGPKGAGQIEVATFRKDLGYTGGRRPDAVEFSTAAEDAKRRDFTINGLFVDPLTEEVLDFVGGRADLEQRVVRAIGDPRLRFEEDKLRLLRGVRFAANLGFRLAEETRAAMAAMAPEVTVVSPERIAAEMRQMLMHRERATAMRLLDELGLIGAVLPQLIAHQEPRESQGTTPGRLLAGQAGARTFAMLARLREPTFALALAALLAEFLGPDEVAAVCRGWRLSNRDAQRCVWLVEHRRDLVSAADQPWPRVQRLLIHPGIEELVQLHEAAESIGRADLAFCRGWLARPPGELDPPLLVTGDDLLRHGVPGGKHFQWLLETLRDAQLEQKIHSREEALALVDILWPPS